MALPALEIKNIPIPVIPTAPEFQEGDDEEVLVTIYELRNAVYHFELEKLYENYSSTLFDLLVKSIIFSEEQLELRAVAEKKAETRKQILSIYIPSSLGVITVLTLIIILK